MLWPVLKHFSGSGMDKLCLFARHFLNKDEQEVFVMLVCYIWCTQNVGVFEDVWKSPTKILKGAARLLGDFHL